MAAVSEARVKRVDVLKMGGLLAVLVFVLGTYFVHLKPDPPTAEQVSATLNDWFQSAVASSLCPAIDAALKKDAGCGPSGASCRERVPRLRSALQACSGLDGVYSACITSEMMACLAGNAGSYCSSYKDAAQACFVGAVSGKARERDTQLDADIANAGTDELAGHRL